MLTNKFSTLVIIFLSLSILSFSYAEEKPNTKQIELREKYLKQIQKIDNMFDEVGIQLTVDPDALTSAEILTEHQVEYLKEFYKHETKFLTVKLIHQNWIRQHHVKIFTWQYYSSIITFWIVIIMVLIGLLLSYLQFHNYFKSRNGKNSVVMEKLRNEIKGDEKIEKASESKRKQPRTTISVGKEGIKIDSPIIGILILFFSFMFFYLYISIVHPISISETMKTVMEIPYK